MACSCRYDVANTKLSGVVAVLKMLPIECD